MNVVGNKRLTQNSLLVLGLLLSFPVLICAFVNQHKSRNRNWSSALSKAPSSAAAKENPYAGKPDAALAGAKLFRQHCADCHGLQGAGTERAPALVSPSVHDAAQGTLFWFLTNGNLRHGMPPWSGLPSQQRWQIVIYLKSLDSEHKHFPGHEVQIF